MMYVLALGLAASLGVLTLRLITGGRFPFYLGLFLGTALGLGVVSQMIFYLQLWGNNFNHFLPPLVTILLLAVFIYLNRSIRTPLSIPKNWSLGILLILAIPLCLEAHFYPLGGWDAWSCWNLKAKFIYLGAEHWKDVLAPGLWRSNTNYPLALPTLNVWFWHWTGFSQQVTMLNAVLLTLLTAGTLLLGLQELKVPSKTSILITLAVFTLGLGNTLSISQYSDMLSSLYLLSAFVCYLLYTDKKDFAWLILTAIFTGLLSFTKNEGLVAAGILAFLILILKPSRPLLFLGVLTAAALPEIIFNLTMAPHNEAFINGLTSADKPSNLARLGYILIYPFVELIGLQWNGLWILALGGIIAGHKEAFKRPMMIIGLFIALYVGVVLAYYQVNTFFAIDWWMKNTLNRILFALMPVVFLWMGVSLKKSS